MKPIVYLDMDGVLADFEGWAFNVVGPDWKNEINQSGWGIFTQYPNLFTLLPVMERAKELYEGCCEFTKDRNQVQLLTALPNRARSSFPNAARDKINWAKYNVHRNIRVVFGPYAQDKQYHCRLSEDILIDDTKINIDQWGEKGGIGILHSSMELTLKTLNNLNSL